MKMTLRPKSLAYACVLSICMSCAWQRGPSGSLASGGNVQRFEHWCANVDGVPGESDLAPFGAQGWELVSATFRPPVVTNGNSIGGGATVLCFKRPR
jgi:hypothetical protein